MKSLIYILSILLFVAGTNGVAQSYDYKVRYGMIHAGSAHLEHSLDNEILNSSLSINSSPWLSTLWSLSDSIKSQYHVESAKLLNHYKAIHEGSYHRNYEVVFSDSDSVVVNSEVKSVDTQGLRDIPSLLYYLSHFKFTDGETLHFRLWDGRSYGLLSLKVEKMKKPSLLNPFASQGWKLSPLSSTKKSRENQIRLALLFSNNFPHLPLRIEIDTKYGDVVMKLEKP